MKKLFFIAISLILLITGCTSKVMLIRKTRCKGLEEVTPQLNYFYRSDKFLPSPIVSVDTIFVNKNDDILKESIQNPNKHNLYLTIKDTTCSHCDSLYNKYLIYKIKDLVNYKLYEDISDFQEELVKEYLKEAMSLILKYKENHKYFYKKDEDFFAEEYEQAEKRLKWLNLSKSEKQKILDREQKEWEREREKELLKQRKNFGKYFKNMIISSTTDMFTEECLIPHCKDYEVWTSGPEYKYINVSSPYMDEWRVDHLLNLLSIYNELRTVEDYYHFTRIYWRNSRTGKGWVYHSYWDVRNK